MTVFFLLRKFSVITFLVLFGDPDFFMFESDSECLLLECRRLISSGAPFRDQPMQNIFTKHTKLCQYVIFKDPRILISFRHQEFCQRLKFEDIAQLIVTADTGHYKIEDDRTWVSL
jgi:hypothetical protein